MPRSMEDILAQLGTGAAAGPMGPAGPTDPMGMPMGPGPEAPVGGPAGEPIGQVDETGNITCPHCGNTFTL